MCNSFIIEYGTKVIYNDGIINISVMKDGWQIPNKRHKKRKVMRAERKELLEKCPDPMLRQKATNLQFELNIDNLASTLLGEKSKKLQLEGWVYVKVLRPEDNLEIREDFEYEYIENFNRWGDKIVFARTID